MSTLRRSLALLSLAGLVVFSAAALDRSPPGLPVDPPKLEKLEPAIATTAQEAPAAVLAVTVRETAGLVARAALASAIMAFYDVYPNGCPPDAWPCPESPPPPPKSCAWYDIWCMLTG